MTTHVYTWKCPGCGNQPEFHINCPNATPGIEDRLKARYKICSKCGAVMGLVSAIEGTSDCELAYRILTSGSIKE